MACLSLPNPPKPASLPSLKQNHNLPPQKKTNDIRLHGARHGHPGLELLDVAAGGLGALKLVRAVNVRLRAQWRVEDRVVHRHEEARPCWERRAGLSKER